MLFYVTFFFLQLKNTVSLAGLHDKGLYLLAEAYYYFSNLQNHMHASMRKFDLKVLWRNISKMHGICLMCLYIT